MIVAKLSNSHAIGVEDVDLRALVIHLRDGDKRLIAHDRAHSAEQLLRRGISVTQRCVELRPPNIGGQFDVPPVILTAGAAAQSDLRPGQAQVSRVVVGG